MSIDISSGLRKCARNDRFWRERKYWMTTSNAVVDKKDDKTEKPHEKLAEKRRALGRGLESLLPGPRVVVAPTLPQSARNDEVPVAPAKDAPLNATPPTMEIVD